MGRRELLRPGRCVSKIPVGLLILAVAGSCLAPPLSGQGFGRSPGGEIGFSFQSLRRGSLGTTSSDAVYRQWIKLPFRGSLLDPRILGFDISISPGFTQRTSPGLPEALTTEELNFGFSVRVLPSKPLTLTLTSNRASGSTSGGFGAEGEFGTESLNGVLRYTNRLLPMEFRYTRLSRDNTWISGLGLAPIQWSNESRTLRFDARNRKTAVRLDKMEFVDRLGRSSFSTFDASLDHRLRWGKGSELQSSWDSNERAGSLQSTRSTWRERLHVQHTEGAYSDYSFLSSSLGTPRGDRRTRSYSGSLRTRPTRWLNLGGQASGRHTRFNGSSDEALGGGPNASLSFRTPGGGRVSASGAYGFERRTRINIAGGTLEVIDEAYAVDETRSFLLEHPHIELASIVVRNAEDGIFYSAEVEYRVVAVGDLVEIIVLPGTRIQPGSSLLVSYQYRIPELPSGSLTTGRYSVSLSLKGVTVQHTRSLRDSQRENGEALLGFSTFDETRSSVRVDWSTPLGRFDLDAQMRERASSAFDFETAEISSSLALPFWRGVQLSLGGSGRRTRDDGGELQARSVYSALLWSPHPRLQFNSRVQVLELDLSQGSRDRSLGGYLNIVFGAGQIEGSIRLEYDRRIEPRDYSGGRLYLRLTRRL